MNAEGINSILPKITSGFSRDVRHLHQRIDYLRALGREHYWFSLAERYYLELKHDRVTGLAAELAFRFFLAFFPFLIFIASASGYVSSVLHIANPTNEIMTLLGDSLPNDASNIIRGEIENVISRHSPTLLSLSVLLAIWVSAGGISTVMSRVNIAFDIEDSRKIYVRYAMAIGLALAGGMLIVVALTVSVAGQVYGYQIAGKIGLSGTLQHLVPLVRYPVVVLLVFVAVSVLYWLSPNAKIPFRWVIPGSSAFVVAWLVASWGYGFYVGHFASYGSIYGTLGGVVITLIWFYITALVLLIGAELTAMLIKERASYLLPDQKMERTPERDYREGPQSRGDEEASSPTRSSSTRFNSPENAGDRSA